MAKVRIAKEYQVIKNEKAEYYSAAPIGPNIFTWHGSICGPVNTPYQGGTFIISLHFPPNYPFVPPHVKFLTPIYHPNINSRGEICLNILKREWSPALTIKVLLLSLYSLLCEPNMEDPLVPEMATLFRENPEKYSEEVQAFTQKHAI